MPRDHGKEFLVVAREALSGWPEARALPSITSEHIARFIFEDIICRHGCFRRLLHDGGTENKGAVAVLTEQYGIKRIITSAYYPEGNSWLERGHPNIVDAISKANDGKVEG